MSVESLISSAEARTARFVSTAGAALQTAVSAVERMGYTQISFAGSTLPAPPQVSGAIQAPSFAPIDLALPTEPAGGLIFQDIPAIDAGEEPVLTATPPMFMAPTKPSQLGGFTKSAPAINTSIAFPEPPPELLNPLIEPPLLPTRVEPEKPQISLPAFIALSPVDTSEVPTDLQGSFDRAYHGAAPEMITMINGYVDAQLTKINPQYSTQMAAIESQLTKYLAGGTGLSTTVEDAIYARAQAKNDVEAMRVQNAAFADAAARGFTLPTGVLVSALARARQEAANNNAKQATDIAVAQAEMEQKNLQFAVTTSAGLRTAMLNATLSYMQNLGTLNGQALDYAKTILSSIIELYNTSVKAFSVKLDAYRAEAAVFETRLKGAMAGIELYKAEIDALQALAVVDRMKVEVYSARIQTLVALANVYRAQIEAVQGRVGLEKLRLEIFQSEVQAYSAQVQSKNAEWQGYTAEMNGETAKAQIYGTQVQAFGTEVQAFRARVDAQAESIRAMAGSNEARARQYTALMGGYQTVVAARGQVASTKLENQRQQVVAFQAQTQAAVANAQVANEYYKSTSLVGIENAKLSIEAMVTSASNAREYAKTLAQLHSANASIHGNLAGAALSGMNTLSAETLAS